MNQPLASRRRAIARLAATAAAFALSTALSPARAQAAWPTKPLRLVVPFAPGGAADVIARIIAKGVGAQLNQQVNVDNKPGADGIIAVQEVIREEGLLDNVKAMGRRLEERLVERLGNHRHVGDIRCRGLF